MRWMFLLLLILNVFYYVWHQQEVPMQPKEVASLSMHKPGQQDIHLLSEAKKEGAAGSECLYLGGYPAVEQLAVLQQRLTDARLTLVSQQLKPERGGGFWLRVGTPGQPLPEENTIRGLTRDLNDIKHQIMPCQGIATGE